jgi:hypothetical protein
MGGGSLTIIGRRTVNVSYLHEFPALWNTKLVPPTVNGFACIAVFGPALRTFDLFHIHAAGLIGRTRRLMLLRVHCPYRKLKTADRDRESADTRCR